MTTNKNILSRADSYKYSHFMQYPRGITNNNSYIESRGIDTKSGLPETTEVVFFGLSVFLQEYLSTPITKEDVEKVQVMVTAHGMPFNYDGWMKIVDKLDGYLPIEIYAVAEGTPVKPGNVLVQVRATHPDYYWLVSFVETAILRAVWYPSTVATLSREVKKIIKQYLTLTTDDDIIESVLPFRLHDFGARGVSSSESAELGGMAHLVNFMGTDTVEALFAAEKYYRVKGPVGFSIPASEHSTITSWGRENEFDAFENMIDMYGGPGKLFACVSDSFNIFDAVEKGWGGKLKDKVLSNGGTVVIRPDSGDPVGMVLSTVKTLDKIFGSTVNSKGYKVLHPAVRVIQGDGVNIKTIESILNTLAINDYSAENIAFGMGGGLLQQVNRDTLKFAMKTSAVEINGEWIDVFKDPIGMEMKKSKKGILSLVQGAGEIVTVRKAELLEGEKDYLKLVWNDGFFYEMPTFEQIRENAKI